MTTYSQDIHVTDVGTNIVLILKDGGTAVDISAATTKQIIFKRPDGTVLTKTASFHTDGTDGALVYKLVSGDVPSGSEGLWKVQAYVAFSSTEQFHSDLANLNVQLNLN